MLLLHLTLFPGFSMSRSPRHFNSLLHHDPDFIAFVIDRIDLFISTNSSPDVSAKTMQACKAYLRGEIISYAAYKIKRMNESRSKLSNSLADVQSNCVNSTNSHLFVQQRQSLIYLLQMRQLTLSIKHTAIIMNLGINQVNCLIISCANLRPHTLLLKSPPLLGLQLTH